MSYTLKEDELRAVQLCELEMLREVDRICAKCGIRYTIIAGTLLGAVRHGGFIPWDDDADVAFLRPAYEKFREACRTELDTARFEFQDHTVTPGYRWGYGKLRRKGSAFVREHQEKMPYFQGIFIDLFPLDPVPAFYPFRAAHAFLCFAVRKILWARVGKDADRSSVKRRIYAALDRIPEKTALSLLDSLVRGAAYIRSPYVRILMFPTPDKHFAYRRRWYEERKTIRFEGIPFYAVARAEEYLSFKYGDFRTLPPPKERKIHPVSFFRAPED
ncbi:MAG: LicD family protein [Lachnospiraceae bacterium]|nr:LicD family protein [Lachnospiraceae bacterium]